MHQAINIAPRLTSIRILIHRQNLSRLQITDFGIGEMDRTKSPDHENYAIPTKTSLASQYEKCIYTFGQLYARLESRDHNQDLLSSVEDEIGRFRVWAADAGAHQSARVSLDYRLREAPHVHSRVSELIEEIQEDVENGTLPHMFTPGGEVIELH